MSNSQSIDAMVKADPQLAWLKQVEARGDVDWRQVNPLSLPGFTLPAEQNGLFRLSGQGGSAQQTTQANIGPQDWTMGSASVSSFCEVILCA
nr:hypothetical protein [Pseudomonas chlororaphis]